MKKLDVLFKVLGLLSGAGFSIIGLVMDARKKQKLTEEDKDDIAGRVVQKLNEAKKTKSNSKVPAAD